MRTLFKVAISISGLAVIAAPGFGQGIRPMDLSSAGTGLVHVNGHDATVSSVHVTLAAGGNATIVIQKARA